MTTTDDRSAAKLLTEAASIGTQVIAIGEPLPLQAVGIDGWFRAADRLVDGLALDENRRPARGGQAGGAGAARSFAGVRFSSTR
ncbi:hypothetical protein [Streptomyces sp. NPDC002640]